MEEYQIFFKIQGEIFSTLIINYNDYKFLQKPTSSFEKDQIRKNDFLQRSKFNIWMITIIDLCKLYGIRKEKYCFHKGLTSLEEYYWSTSWKQKMPRKLLKDLKTELNCDETNKVVKKVKTLRNKLYAHKDPEFDKYFNDFHIRLEEIDTLIDIGKKIIFEINKYYFDSHTFFTVGGLQTAKSFIYRLENNK